MISAELSNEDGVEILVGRKLPDAGFIEQQDAIKYAVLAHQILGRSDLFVLRSRHHLLKLFADASLFGEHRWCRDCRDGTTKEEQTALAGDGLGIHTDTEALRDSTAYHCPFPASQCGQFADSTGLDPADFT
jgi:hypothetical protein